MQNFLKAGLWLTIAGILTFSSIFQANAQASNNEKPKGRLVCSVNDNNGSCIYLYEQKVDGVYAIVAYSKSDNKYTPKDVFKVKGTYCPVIKSAKCENWTSSAPNGAYFVFNKADNTLYLPLIVTGSSKYAGANHQTLTSADRYLVYKFDGNHFVYQQTGAGFWLHKDLRSFKSLVFVGKTKDYLVRIDETKDGFRYAAWKSKNEMSGKPDLVLTGMQTLGNGTINDFFGFSFDNNGYTYDVWTANNFMGPFLKVSQGNKLLMEQQMRVIASILG